MRSLALTSILILLVGPAVLATPPETPSTQTPLPKTPVSKDALHFRVEVGIEPGHFIVGWLDEMDGTGTGFDAACLDFDGDGAADEVQVFKIRKNTRTGKDFRESKITFRLDEAEWVLDLYAFRSTRPTPTTDGLKTYIRWSVRKEGFYAWFINGRVVFHRTAAAAAKAPAIRLGPPFHFETGSTMRATRAMVRVGLKDTNGCTLRLASMDKERTNLHIRLAKGEEEHFSAPAAYG